MSNSKNITIIGIGGSGAGKSTVGNTFIQKDDAFETNSKPDTCTYITSEKCNEINGIIRHYIDTQGTSSPDGLDSYYMKQMIEFLKEWKLGINAIFIIINIQYPRFDQEIQLVMKMINDFFNNPQFWNQTGIIFTRCYPGLFDRNTAEKQYRQLVINLIKSFPGCESLNLQMPCFFVDSPNYKSDESTKNEYIKIFEFAHKNKPVSTKKFQLVRREYKNKEEIINKRILVKTSYSGNGANRKKTLTYEDQKIYKITDWKDQVTFTNPETIRTWNEYKYSIIKIEEGKEPHTTNIPIYRTEYGGRKYGICGPRSSWQVLDHYETQTTYTNIERDMIIDPDGNITYGEWRVKN